MSEAIEIVQNEQSGTTQPEENGVRTFSQDELNRIISERLAKEKAKNEAEFVKREKELHQREMNLRAKEILAERGLPKELASVLRYSDEESLNNALDTIQNLQGFKKEEKKAGNVREIEVNQLPKDSGNVGDSFDAQLRKAFDLK